MLINEVIKSTGLTKKAVEYYIEKKLLVPSVLDNGYRNFTDSDIERLNKISILRKLGIGMEDIKTILDDESKSTLKDLTIKKELDLQREQFKKTILDKLAKWKTYSEISEELKIIDNSKTITEKILEAFPGYYGRFICLHFARFLNEPIKTNKQRLAYKKIISFLDNAPKLELPENLKEYLNDNTKNVGMEKIKEMIENKKKSIENPDEFLSKNKDFLKQYLTYKKSDEYKKSPTYKITEIMKKFYKTSGYNDIFIPALKVLSPSYAEYYKQLETANKKLIERYPCIENLSDKEY